MIDIKSGLENSQGNMKVYLQVLRYFCLESEAVLLKMHTLWESKDEGKLLKILIHGLKGTAANIGALSFSEESMRMEEGLLEEPYTIDDLQLSEYIVSYLSVLTEAKELLKEHGISIGDDTWCLGTKSFTQFQWDKVMQAVNVRLMDYEPEAAQERLYVAKQWKLPKDLMQKLRDLDRALEMIEYEKAEEILNELRKITFE